MEKMNEIFAEALKDFRGALTQAAQEPRTYNKVSNHIYKPEAARMKLVIYRKDGNNRYYYSYDSVTNNKIRHIDEYEGFLKLLRLVNKNKGEFKNAIIYASIDENLNTKNSNYEYQIAYFDMYGNIKTNTAVNFKLNGINNLLDIKFLSTYGKKIINK